MADTAVNQMVDAASNEVVDHITTVDCVKTINSTVKRTNLPQNIVKQDWSLENLLDMKVKTEDDTVKHKAGEVNDGIWPETHNSKKPHVKVEVSETPGKLSEVTVKVEECDVEVKLENDCNITHKALISKEIIIKEENCFKDSLYENHELFKEQATDIGQFGNKKNAINFNNIKLQLSQKLNIKPKLYTCDVCGFTHRKRSNMLAHMKSHKIPTSENSYSCPQCDFKTNWKRSIDAHVKIHGDVEHLVCSYCDFKTGQRGKFWFHMRKHLKERFFKCSLCSFKTKQKSTYRTHFALVHNEGKPFRCDKCNFETERKLHLQTHMKVHHSIKYYKCNDCEYETRKRHHLQRHFKTHLKTR